MQCWNRVSPARYVLTPKHEQDYGVWHESNIHEVFSQDYDDLSNDTLSYRFVAAKVNYYQAFIVLEPCKQMDHMHDIEWEQVTLVMSFYYVYYQL